MSELPMPVIVVDWNSEEPVYEQIARQIRGRIASGDLPAGAVLPSVRSVASDLGINLNTVARAYRILEEEGFVVIRDRAGVTVAPPARRADRAVVERLTEELGVVLARMKQAGVSAADLRRCFEHEMAELDGRNGK